VGAYFLDLVRGSASTYFTVNKNNVFKQNSKKQNLPYLKIRYFLKKKAVKPPQRLSAAWPRRFKRRFYRTV